MGYIAKTMKSLQISSFPRGYRKNYTHGCGSWVACPAYKVAAELERVSRLGFRSLLQLSCVPCLCRFSTGGHNARSLRLVAAEAGGKGGPMGRLWDTRNVSRHQQQKIHMSLTVVRKNDRRTKNTFFPSVCQGRQYKQHYIMNNAKHFNIATYQQKNGTIPRRGQRKSSKTMKW